MTDFGLEGFDPRRERSERVFWVYVIVSVLIHVALVSWLVTADFDLPTTTPAILVRLINPEADTGGGQPAGGGPTQSATAAAALAAPLQPATRPAAAPLPTVSPVKEETSPPSPPEPAAPVLATAPALAGNADPAAGVGDSGPGGPDDGSGPGGPGGDGSGAGPGNGSGAGPGGAGEARRGLPSDYTNDMLARIMRNRHYPEVCRDNHIEGTVRVWLKINPDGSVAGVKLASSSGSEELDRAGIAAVEKTTFAPFPPGLDLPPQRIKVPVDFSIRE